MVTAGMSARVFRCFEARRVWHPLQHNSPPSLATAIRLVMSGEMWVDQKISQLMAAQVQQGEQVSP